MVHEIKGTALESQDNMQCSKCVTVLRFLHKNSLEEEPALANLENIKIKTKAEKDCLDALLESGNIEQYEILAHDFKEEFYKLTGKGIAIIKSLENDS